MQWKPFKVTASARTAVGFLEFPTAHTDLSAAFYLLHALLAMALWKNLETVSKGAMLRVSAGSISLDSTFNQPAHPRPLSYVDPDPKQGLITFWKKCGSG